MLLGPLFGCMLHLIKLIIINEDMGTPYTTNRITAKKGIEIRPTARTRRNVHHLYKPLAPFKKNINPEFGNTGTLIYNLSIALTTSANGTP